MKFAVLFLSLFTFVSFAQKEPLKINADTFIGVDNLEHIYYLKNNILHKNLGSKTLTYNNLHLGNVTLVDITNPLKIVVFYKDFNSAIILDDNLNELSNTIDFNTILFKNISFVGTASNSNLWLFSKDDNNLILFNYLTKKVILSKQMDDDFIFEKAISNYHNIWLISKLGILKYNAYLSYLVQYNIENIEKESVFKNDLIYKTNDEFLYLLSDEKSIKIPTIKGLIIKDFDVKNDRLFFFDGNTIYSQEFIKK